MRIAILLAALAAAPAGAEDPPPNPYAAWKRGPSARSDYFPIAVWLQSTANAAKYKAAGINLYVGLWRGPSEAQLAELTRHGMPVICSQNEAALKHKDNPIIVGWMHGDEPDNAQARRDGKGYGPPIPPEKIVEDYKKIRERDPSRPVLLNLGQGVAWDGWYGRGVRTNKPEDYPKYGEGCDIASFDIYPGCHDHKDVAGKLWMVGDGVRRLRDWTGNRKPVWSCIECTRISNVERMATPAEVRAEVWMALVRGARGLIYFSHQFKPKFIEAGLLADAEMLASVTATNKQIASLAQAHNGPDVEGGVTLESNSDVPVEALAKRHGGATYIFAVPFRSGATDVVFRLPKSQSGKVEAIDESRTLELKDGAFRDRFEKWAVHLYRIAD